MTASNSSLPHPSVALVPPPGCDRPLELPPAPTHHPLRLRKVLRLLRNLHEAEDQVEAGLQLFDAVGGVGGERTFQRFTRQPEGQRLLRTRPDLVALLGDRDSLAAMPEGSLGRAYLAFAEENGFSADGLVEKNREIDREIEEVDPHRQWFWDRFTITHDLWHVLTGCPTTQEGEATLLAFSHAQTPQRGYLILLALSAVGAGFDFAAHRSHWRAWRAGHRAGCLLTAPWEELLAWPLQEVRRCYDVEELMA